MIAFAEYLLKVILCSALLTGYYWFALRNKLFHAWNRFYLLASVVIAFGLPFLKIPFLQEEQQQGLPAYQILQSITTDEVWFEETTTTAAVKQSFFSAENVSLLLYLLVSFITLIILLIAIIRIIRLIKKYQHWKINNLVFVDTDAKGTPFSFLSFVFWNREIDFNSEQGQQIFAHELVHVKQKHSWDKLFINIVLIFFWSNPFFWLIRKELTMIHEFIADEQSVKDHDTASFAAMIIATAFPGYNMPLTNPFFYSPIKRRLQMLSKLQNPKIGYISRLLLLPLLIFLFTAFAVKIKETSRTSSIPALEKPMIVVIDAGHGFKDGKRNGAEGLNGISEDEIALAIAKKIEQMNSDENLKLIFTRTDKNFIEANERVRITKESKADLFVSIHSSFVPKIKKDGKEFENPMNGFELYVAKDGTSNLEESKELGSAIINEMRNIMTIREPGIKQRNAGIYVISAATCPAVLLECGFVSNSKDVAFLTDEKNQEKIAEAVLKGIVNYAYRKNKVSVTEPITIIVSDTTPKPSKDAITLIADSIEFKSIKNTDQLIIINGKKSVRKMPDSFLINAKTVTVIKKKNKEAIAKYGPEAKNGVIIFEDTIITKKNDLDKTENQNNEPVFTKAEKMPEFPGGIDKLLAYLHNTLTAKKEPLSTDKDIHQLEIEIIIDKNGKITRATILKGVKNETANALVKVLLNSPAWSPAIQNGHNVAVLKKLNISYQSANPPSEHWFSVRTN